MEANSREGQQQAIDAEIKSLEQSIRELRYRRNALAPISSLPTEVIAVIFSILRLSDAPLAGGKRDHLAWLRVTHVCHQWREIALNNPLFWNHIDFTNITLAGAVEMLVRAEKAPLHLEAWVTGHHRGDARFDAFKKELQSRVTNICHLEIGADASFLRRILKRLASPAHTLESLSLSTEATYWLRKPSRASIPDTLFGGTAPRLSFLELHRCNISWKSPLLKGLRYLEIYAPSQRARPSISVWLDALDEMLQLKKLVLHSASPVAPPIPFNIERTVTLPFLTHLNISSSPGDCALALSHLILPALTRLCITARSIRSDGGDVLKFLRYVVQHAHGPQDAQPLQNVLIRGERNHIGIFAGPDSDIEDYNWPFWLTDMTEAPRPRLALSVTCRDWWLSDTYILILDEAIATLPLDSLMKLTVQNETLLDKEFWLYHAPRWSLLKCVRLAPLAARGLREIILEDNGGRECPLLPSLTTLHLLGNTLTVRRALRLCNALMKRVSQGVPLGELDLRTCNATSYAVQLLSEAVASVRSPGALYSPSSLPDDDSGTDDDPDGYYESGPYRGDDDEDEDEGGMDDDGEEEED
jgi:hypothetical protein